MIKIVSSIALLSTVSASDQEAEGAIRKVIPDIQSEDVADEESTSNDGIADVSSEAVDAQVSTHEPEDEETVSDEVSGLQSEGVDIPGKVSQMCRPTSSLQRLRQSSKNVGLGSSLPVISGHPNSSASA
jgi:hypothetical protein